MRIFLYSVIGGLLISSAVNAWATEYPKPDVYITEVYNSYETNRRTSIGLSASSVQFDWSTQKWQAGIGIGTFDGNESIAAGLGKRYGQHMINVKIVSEDGEQGASAGVNWRF